MLIVLVSYLDKIKIIKHIYNEYLLPLQSGWVFIDFHVCTIMYNRTLINIININFKR